MTKKFKELCEAKHKENKYLVVPRDLVDLGLEGNIEVDIKTGGRYFKAHDMVF